MPTCKLVALRVGSAATADGILSAHRIQAHESRPQQEQQEQQGRNYGVSQDSVASWLTLQTDDTRFNLVFCKSEFKQVRRNAMLRDFFFFFLKQTSRLTEKTGLELKCK